MSQGEYPYPPDEFDAVDPSDGPRGAHRRPRSAWSALWPYALALVLSALLAVAVVGVLWDERGGVPLALPALGEPADAPPSDPAATAGATTPAPTGGATSPAPTDGTPAPTPAPSPDTGTPVRVLNSTSAVGLAGEVAERLRDAGWTDVAPGNFTGTLPRSTVRYAEPDLEASARAVAQELGIAAVEQADEGAADAVEVVLEADFPG